MLIDERLHNHHHLAQPKVARPLDARAPSPAPKPLVTSSTVPSSELFSHINAKNAKHSQKSNTPATLHPNILGNASTASNHGADLMSGSNPVASANVIGGSNVGTQTKNLSSSATPNTTHSIPAPPPTLSSKRSLASNKAEIDGLTEGAKELGPPTKKTRLLGGPTQKTTIQNGGAPPDHSHSIQLDTGTSKPTTVTKPKRIPRAKHYQVGDDFDASPKTTADTSLYEMNGLQGHSRVAVQRQMHKAVDPSIGELTVHMHVDGMPYQPTVPHPQYPQSNARTNDMMQTVPQWNTNRIEAHDAMGGRTLTNTKELMLFETIKKYLNDKEVWHDFLRVLELYNHSIIDFKTLLDRVSVYIGDDDELLEDFKGFVGYDVKKDGLVEDEVWEIKNLDIREREKVDASIIQREYGPSYKRLPREEIDLACSGRDELCWSVLNDEYFGAAKFGTESGGPGHRKTNFEEVIAMTEGERAHFSYWLECISRTIGHLESLQTRIDSMDDKERTNFHLGDNLGGTSPSIYHRTLRKIYENKYTSNIFPYLRDYPANSMGIVLKRLKDLELNWKSAESQWNLIWREVERKNYYKAQDHQVLSFKSNDKALMKGANFLKEIQELKETKSCLVLDVALHEESTPMEAEQMLLDRSKLGNLRKSRVRSKPSHALYSVIKETPIKTTLPLKASHQVELGFQDLEIFFDVLRIMVMSLDRSALSHPERRRIDETIRTLIPAVWNITPLELEKQIPMIYDDDTSEPSEDENPTLDPAVNDRDLLSKKGVESLTQGLLKLDANQNAKASNMGELDTPLMSSPPNSTQEAFTSRPYRDGQDYRDEEDGLENSGGRGFLVSQKWAQVRQAEQGAEIAPEAEASQLEPTGPLGSVTGRYYNVFGTSTYAILFRLLHVSFWELFYPGRPSFFFAFGKLIITYLDSLFTSAKAEDHCARAWQEDARVASHQSDRRRAWPHSPDHWSG